MGLTEEEFSGFCEKRTCCRCGAVGYAKKGISSYFMQCHDKAYCFARQNDQLRSMIFIASAAKKKESENLEQGAGI